MVATKRKPKLPKVRVKRSKIKVIGGFKCDGPDYKVTVSINGKVRQPNRRLAGIREKYVFGRYIIKVEKWDLDFDQVKKEKRILSRLTEEERKYFPKTYFCSTKQGYTIQERRKLRYPGYCSEKKQNIVRQLVKKYKLTDVSVAGVANWAICKKTGNPIIYDFGF